MNLSGLTKDCAYYVYVASVCGNTQSDWHYYYFKTDCDYSVVLPYVEDFENFNINETLPCWIAVGYSFVPLVSYIPSTYYGNKKSKMLRFSNGPTLYASPVITTDIRNTQIGKASCRESV